MDGQLLPIPLRPEFMMTPEKKALIDAVADELHLKPAPGYEDHWACIFALPDGGRLYVSTGRQRGSLHVSAGLPDNLRDHRAYYRAGEAPKTSINVSDTKPADRIAGDIRRRLLPEHDREVAASTANKRNSDSQYGFAGRLDLRDRTQRPCHLFGCEAIHGKSTPGYA